MLFEKNAPKSLVKGLCIVAGASALYGCGSGKRQPKEGSADNQGHVQVAVCSLEKGKQLKHVPPGLAGILGIPENQVDQYEYGNVTCGIKFSFNDIRQGVEAQVDGVNEYCTIGGIALNQHGTAPDIDNAHVQTDRPYKYLSVLCQKGSPRSDVPPASS